MKTPHFSVRMQQHLLQTALLLLLLLPLGAAGLWWFGKHQYWQNNLERQESLYARLSGMQEQQEAIAQALAQTQQGRTVFFYPEDQPAEQAAIARLQAEQQQRVIAQLLAERALLNEAQRVRLMELLLRRYAQESSEEELLHRE